MEEAIPQNRPKQKIIGGLDELEQQLEDIESQLQNIQ